MTADRRRGRERTPTWHESDAGGGRSPAGRLRAYEDEGVIAAEIVEDLRAALATFEELRGAPAGR